METLRGFIEHIIYRNDDNGYTVLNLVADAGEITCVGLFRYADEGENVILTGEYKEHPIYGHQFSVSTYEITPPGDEESILRYLSSGVIKGVGAALATRIVKAFGEDTFRIIEEDPERLVEVKGISSRIAREIAIQFADKQEMRKIMVFLQQYGISNSLSVKIYEKYGSSAYDVIRQNPYELAEDINGVGFRIADEIAAKIGIKTDSDYRIRSGLMYVLLNAVGEGHCYLPKEDLVNKAWELLGVYPEAIRLQIENLCMDGKLIIREVNGQQRIYAKQYYLMEISCARMLRDLDVHFHEDEIEVRSRVIKYAEAMNIEVENHQIDAVVNAVVHGVFILTGGPGTGKTTTINLLVRYFVAEGLDFYLAAPTGRAAKRMTEMTGYDAATIQRLLHLQPSTVDGIQALRYDKNEEDPLEADVIIVDEVSMVDLPLLYALLKAVIPGTRLILVGDTNQLPSVGPGTVLRDLIESGCFTVSTLNHIFRQATQSDIVMNAHRIKEGEMIPLDNKSKDFFFMHRDDANHAMKSIMQLIQEKLPKYVDATPYDIQVLTPMRKGAFGVESLNPILQKYLNPAEPNKREREQGNTIFREGDKVIQTRNNYQLEWEISGKYGIVVDKGVGVFNGDLGIIKEINLFSESVFVEYEDKKVVEYPYSLLDELELAYALTVHKSQGSEYPAVIMPLLGGPKMLLNRNLLYTGVTRARKCVVLLGLESLVETMIENNSEYKRYTGLCDCLKEAYGITYRDSVQSDQ